MIELCFVAVVDDEFVVPLQRNKEERRKIEKEVD